MLKDNIKHNINHLVRATEACVKAHWVLPSLTLIYTGIDTMAWLNRPKSLPDVTRDDFIAWVDKFLLPNMELPCSAIELYAARCGIVHSYSPETKLVREGRARPIYYAHGDADVRSLQVLLDRYKAERGEVIALHLTHLFKAFVSGVGKFMDYLEENSEEAELVNERAEKRLGPLSKERVERSI